MTIQETGYYKMTHFVTNLGQVMSNLNLISRILLYMIRFRNIVNRLYQMLYAICM